MTVIHGCMDSIFFLLPLLFYAHPSSTMTSVPRSQKSISKKLAGRCLCSAISWTLENVKIGQVLVCHCSMCRQISGSTSVPFAAVPSQALQEQLRNAKSYRSSEMATRYFCPTCGSFVCMKYHHEQATLWIPMGTLDNESAVAVTQQIDPTRDSHIMMEDRAPFLEIMAQLPQAKGFGPYRSDPCCGRDWELLKSFDNLEREEAFQTDKGGS